MLSQVDRCSYELSQLGFNHVLTGYTAVCFSACFYHAFTGCITVSFSACSLTMFSQVVLQFILSLLYDYTCSHWLYRCICYGFSKGRALTKLYELHAYNY